MSQTTLVYSLYSNESKKRLVTESVSGEVGPVLQRISRSIRKHGGSDKVQLRVRGIRLKEGVIQDTSRLESVTTLVGLVNEHYKHEEMRLAEDLRHVISNPEKRKRLIEALKKKTKQLKELELPSIEKGDILLAGKYKNKKCVVKGFEKDENNQPVAKTDRGDQKIFKPRVAKLMNPQPKTQSASQTTTESASPRNKKKPKTSLDDILPASKGPVHISKEMHDRLLGGGFRHMIGLSKHDQTYDHYEHKHHGRILVDKQGNHKAAPKWERGSGAFSDLD